MIRGFLQNQILLLMKPLRMESVNISLKILFLTEEDEIDIKNLTVENEFLWIIDPICGTTNYLYDFPLYSHSATILQNEALYAAGVLDPVRQELFFSFKNRFYVNDKQFSLTKDIPIEDALISVNTNQSNFDDEEYSLKKIINKLSPPVCRRNENHRVSKSRISLM